MLIIEQPIMIRQTVKQWHKEHKSVALIPTMGNLHEGHISLIKAGSIHSDRIVVSIFVNPMQFDQQEELMYYPRTLQEDYAKLTQHNVDMVFTPTTDIMYPNGISSQMFIDIPHCANVLIDENQTLHFRGVTTIISKLFNLIQPDVAFFGEKDFQQLMIIRRLVHDMNYHTNIISVPTVRAADGLALSSRNSYLSVEERLIAPYLYKTLMWLINQLRMGERRTDSLIATATEQLWQAGLIPDSLIILDAENLQILTISSRKAVVLLSAWLGKARLIDNAQVDLVM